jgi:hypothetical protein
MSALTIDLQDGFSADRVVILVNGREVAARSGVTTKRMIGLAETLSVDVPEGPVRVEVVLPGRGVRGSVEAKEPHLGVSVTSGGLEFIQSRREFGYG